MIKITNLNVSYNDKKVIDSLSLDIPDGITCIMGESGSGKTTLLHTLVGLVKADSGKIEGVPERVSVMFQEDRLFKWMTARENISVVNNDDGVVSKLLEEIELSDDAMKYPNELSGGMRRRIALARALAYPAELYILDEPFKGLDGALRERMARLVKSLGKTVIVTTHSEKEPELLGASIIRL